MNHQLGQCDQQAMQAYVASDREKSNQRARIALLEIFSSRSEETDEELAEQNAIALIDLVGQEYKGDYVLAARDFLSGKELLPAVSNI